jgi:hypothetical protein
MQGLFHRLFRGIKRRGWLVLASLATLVIALWAIFAKREQSDLALDPSPQLTVWVVTTDPRGIAVALNGLAEARRELSLVLQR